MCSRQSPLSVSLRSEEHTSERQSPYDVVFRLLLEKKKIQLATIARVVMAPPTHFIATKHAYDSHNLSKALALDKVVVDYLKIRRTHRAKHFTYTTLFR